jgi:hypothetical protein
MALAIAGAALAWGIAYMGDVLSRTAIAARRLIFSVFDQAG